MESTDSSTCSQHPNLPPGFRFHPTDEELVEHYLRRKAASVPLPVSIVAEVDLYKFDPWELPSKATFGEQEWYFFSPRDRKYPNGMRPNRAAVSGYWKATGTDKPILSSSAGGRKVGVKKALVFYGGKPPKGIKTNWIMHEYRLVDGSSSFKSSLANKKGSLRLDEWVLCRIYKKTNGIRPTERDPADDSVGNTIASGESNQNDQEHYFDASGILQSNSLSKLGSLRSGVSSLGKRPFPAAAHYWNPDSAGKRLHSDEEFAGIMTDGNGSFISLLNPIQQGFHPLGSLGDTAFPYQLSSFNWQP